MRLTRQNCWMSLSPNTVTSGLIRLNSLATTVSTPSKCPGRASPSKTAPIRPATTLTSGAEGYISPSAGAKTKSTPASSHLSRSDAIGRGY